MANKTVVLILYTGIHQHCFMQKQRFWVTRLLKYSIPLVMWLQQLYTPLTWVMTQVS